MKNKIQNPNIAHATYEKNVLTLDLPHATQPMLWRQEIKNVSNIVFWVNAADNGEHALLMKINTGTEQSIARFADEAAAQQALAAVREIFINGKPKKYFLGQLIKIILWVLIIWVVGSFAYELIGGILMRHDMTAEPQHAVTQSTPSQTTPVTPTAAPPGN